MKNIDVDIKTTLWQGENVVIACEEHMKDFVGKPYVIKIERLKEKINCGYRDCYADGVYEIELQRPEKEKILLPPIQIKEKV